LLFLFFIHSNRLTMEFVYVSQCVVVTIQMSWGIKMSKILIIDDNEQFGTMLKFKLEKSGYEVRTALNGHYGIRSLQIWTADLVITDIIMPEKDGIEVIVDISNQFPKAKIIAVSGGGRSGPDSYLDVAKHLGAKRVFAKPLDMPEFIEAVKGLLQE
jgi:CheY-like chemotaxis protein